MDGKTWARYSISIWSDIDKSTEEKRLDHPALFPVALPSRFIEIYTQPGDLVLDPFAGLGSTLLAAQQLGRHSLGIELSPEYVAQARKRLSSTRTNRQNTVLICDDARNLLHHVDIATVKLCVTSPPYWNILNQKRTADTKDKRNYDTIDNNLGNIDNYELFLDSLSEIFEKVFMTLVPGGYCIINVMDLRKKANFFPLHIDLTNKLCRQNYKLDDIIIWDRRKEYNNLRPLGYPYVFRVNKIHEYLLIFRKPAT
ncbi:MAG: site-specific DNA-methyltransferase [Peptococcaceae bacterium]|nr:site-specific DNA-methyltransferase [Peptococcaceae bacterium]